MSRDIYADAARRWAHALPGHTLLSAEATYIPTALLTVDVLAEVVEEIDAARKYALAALLHGVTTVADLELFLGLDEGDTIRTVAGLMTDEFVTYAPGPSGTRALAFTPLGRSAAVDARIRRPISSTVTVSFDRVTRTVTPWPRTTLTRAKYAKERSVFMIPHSGLPPVDLAELTVQTLSAAMSDRGRSAFNLLGVTGVTEDTRHYKDAVLLVYREEGTNAVRLGLEIDGQWSEAHLAPLENLNVTGKLNITADAEVAYDGADDFGPRLNREEVLALQTAAQDEGAPTDTAETLLDRISIRWLSMADHPGLLEDAMTAPKRRLLIISPWINSHVVDNAFLARLHQVAKQASVTIFWGFGDNEKTSKAALERLHNLAADAPCMAVVRVDDTHAKVLVSDGYYVKTSFNWLSFRGDPTRKFRQEEGDLVTDSALAAAAYDRYMRANLDMALEVVGSLPPGYNAPKATHVTRGQDVTNRSRSAGRQTAPQNGRGSSKHQMAGGEPATGNQTARAATSQNSGRREEPKRAKLAALRVDQIVTAKVRNLTTFGAFIDFDGVSGLVHISQIADQYLGHPSDVLTVGQDVQAKVIEIDMDHLKVSLSIRAVN